MVANHESSSCTPHIHHTCTHTAPKCRHQCSADWLCHSDDGVWQVHLCEGEGGRHSSGGHHRHGWLSKPNPTAHHCWLSNHEPSLKSDCFERYVLCGCMYLWTYVHYRVHLHLYVCTWVGLAQYIEHYTLYPAIYSMHVTKFSLFLVFVFFANMHVWVFLLWISWAELL